jgi:hypothetical protein
MMGQSKSSRNSLDIDDLEHHEFVRPGQSVAGHFYVQVLQRKRRDKWQAGTVWFLHHDNAPSHTSLFVQQVLAERNTSVIT